MGQNASMGPRRAVAGRSPTARTRFPASLLRRDLVVAGLLALVALLVWLPLRPEALVNWDAVNFALGVGEFDLQHHQPHPPGYIGYVLVGRAATLLLGDPNAGLTALSVLGGALSVAMLYLLCRRFAPRRHALTATLLFGTAPLVWYYSLVALSYMVATALALSIGYVSLVARRERSERHLLAAAVLLCLLGSIRQTDMLMLLPVAVFAAARFGWGARLRAGGVLVVGCLAWVLPLMLLAGGPGPYAQLSSELAALAGGPTWVLAGNAVGLLQNGSFVAAGLLLGLGGALVVLARAGLARVRPLRGLHRDDRRFLLLLALPSLAVDVLLHTGQLGYVLLLLPPLFVVVAVASHAMAEAPERRPARRWRRLRTAWVGPLGAANLAGFVMIPPLLMGALSPANEGAVREFAGSLIGAGDQALAARARQYDLATNDAYWHELTGLVESYDPDETVVLAVPASGGSLRHLAYYLDDYRIHAVGWDRDSVFGFLFATRAGTPSYQIADLERAARSLHLPETVRYVVVPDEAIRQRLDAAVRKRTMRMPDRSLATVLCVPPGSRLVLTGADGDEELRVSTPRGRVGGQDAAAGCDLEGGPPPSQPSGSD